MVGESNKLWEKKLIKISKFPLKKNINFFWGVAVPAGYLEAIPEQKKIEK